MTISYLSNQTLLPSISNISEQVGNLTTWRAEPKWHASVFDNPLVSWAFPTVGQISM